MVGFNNGSRHLLGKKEAAIAKATIKLKALDGQLRDIKLIMNRGFSLPLLDLWTKLPTSALLAPWPFLMEPSLDFPSFFIPMMIASSLEIPLLSSRETTVEFNGKYLPNKVKECKGCYGTFELEHPGTVMVATKRGRYYMEEKIIQLNFPVRDFPCKTPAKVREELPDDKVGP
jgi:sulfate adenylyltransferase